MPIFYKTNNPIEATIAAHREFSHVILNRGYHTLTPVYVSTKKLNDYPIFMHVPWKNNYNKSIGVWQEKGGIMINSGESSKGFGKFDSVIFIECPIYQRRIEESAEFAQEEVIISYPVSWFSHQKTVSTYNPHPKELIKILRAINQQEGREYIAKASRYPNSKQVVTDEEISYLAKIGENEVALLKKKLKPKFQEIWEVKLLFKPEQTEMLYMWNKIKNMETSRIPETNTYLLERWKMSHENPLYTWKRVIKNMGKLGHISLKIYNVFPEERDCYIEELYNDHLKEIASFKEIQKFVEALPEYPLE